MSAFQDFGPLSERRKAERQQIRRKHFMIAGASTSVLVILVVAGVAAVVYNNKHSVSGPSGDVSTHELHSSSKEVKMMCSLTKYQHSCETSLSKAVNSSSSSVPKPKDLIKAAVSVIVDEIGKAISRSNLIKTDDPMVKGAIEDCKMLFQNSKEELMSSVDTINAHSLDELAKRPHDLTNWLSAVMSYQQTCIDGFPDGELKSKMTKGLKAAKELTSNALAIIGQAASFLSLLNIPELSRRLVSEESTVPTFHEDGYPHWVSDDVRRHLQQHATFKLTPNVTVAKDGSGNFTTISEALDSMPKKYVGRYVIYVKEGVYEETVLLGSRIENVTMYGDGSRKTIVTGSKNFVDGVRTYHTATFATQGFGFIAIAMGFRNTAGAIKHQAVALRVQSDSSIFLNCRMEGYQDTLYAQTHRQFYRSCVIAGTIDYIFGDASAVFQNCVLVVRRPLDNQQNTITAHGRTDPYETTGFVIQACRIIADKKLLPDAAKLPSYLARPWKEYSRTIFMESNIGGFIHPDGYLPWNGDFALKTLYYAEYKNEGPGADVSNRVKWPGVKILTKLDDALQFTTYNFLHGADWIKAAGTPVRMGFFH